MWIKLQMNDGKNRFIMDVQHIIDYVKYIEVVTSDEVYTIEKPQDEPIRINNVKNVEYESLYD